MNENSSLLVANSSATRDDEVAQNDGPDGEKYQNVKQLEACLENAGFGLFHVLLLLIAGLAVAADAVEIFGISFVVPVAERDLHLSSADKGWLDAIIFVGMMVGGYLWGSLSDVVGRRTCLISAMFVNGTFSIISAFSPNFYFFLVFRFASGIGVGGSQPVMFSYVSEFFTEKKRGPVIVILASCWQPGIIFTALLALALLGSSAEGTVNFYLGSLHIVNWRIFLMICTIPSFVSAVSLIFMPETPTFLYQMKRFGDAKKVLRRIQRINSCCVCYLNWKQKNDKDSAQLLSVEISTTEMEASRNMNTSTDQHTDELYTHKKAHYCLTSKARKILDATLGLFSWMYLRATLLLLVIWFTQSFGYYGLQLWFPEFFKRLQKQSCSISIPLNNCSNSSSSLQYYQDSLYVALASLPGNIAGALLINVIGARVQLAVAMILSTASVFSIWKVPNNHAVVLAVSCVFSAVTVTVFGSLDVVVMSTYKTALRSTAFGIHAGMGRIGAILGNVTFGHLIDADRSLPILLVAAFLGAGAVASVFLPPIYRTENRPPFQRAVVQLWKRCRSKSSPDPVVSNNYGSSPSDS